MFSNGVQLSPDLIEIFILMFADDVVFFSESVIGLQRQINVLETYCKKWALNVNLDKTKIMVFKRGSKLSKSEKWTYKSTKLEVVTSYQYLGVSFNSTLNWSLSAKNISIKAKKALVSVTKCLCNLKVVSVFILQTGLR